MGTLASPCLVSIAKLTEVMIQDPNASSVPGRVTLEFYDGIFRKSAPRTRLGII